MWWLCWELGGLWLGGEFLLGITVVRWCTVVVISLFVWCHLLELRLVQERVLGVLWGHLHLGVLALWFLLTLVSLGSKGCQFFW